jgi:glycosyltransferase involved in cell wall biosynthesis
MNPITIGVAIPCYQGHLEALGNLLESIECQSRKPDMVFVSCSSAPSSVNPYASKKYSFPFHIIFHPEKKNAAENRNIAASYLTTDIITFIDADDIMHPQRIAVIDMCFTTYQHVAILMHHCKMDPNEPFEHYEHLDCFQFNRLFQCPNGSTQHRDYLYMGVLHNGQPSVPRDVFITSPFDESASSHGKEDTVFCTRIITMFPEQTAYCPYQLSGYVPSGTGGHEDIKK